MKKLAVIGCGIAAVPILKKAREKKIITFCFALEENEKAVGLSDYFYNIDIYDIDGICEKCKINKVDGVIATSETTTVITAIIAEKLKLNGNVRINNEFVFKNKYLMREALKDSAYVCQPCFWYQKKDIANKKNINFPVVVKALDSCGKKGITFVNKINDLDSAIDYAFSVTSKESILIEEYIDGGIEYSVECLSYHGKHYIIQVTQKDSGGAPHFVELGHHQPANIDLEIFKKLRNSINDILTRIGITNSMSHVEIKILNDKIYFIELGARAGGDFIGDTLVELSTDFDYFGAAIDVSLNCFTPCKVNNTAFSGIYFLCNQTSMLRPFFKYASTQEWCKKINYPKGKLIIKNGNDDGGKSGYLIYKSDHKITLKDYPFKAERINNKKNCFELLIKFNKKTNRVIDSEVLKLGMEKFIKHGNVISILYNNEIIAMCNIYCNHNETKIAYLNNLEVLENFRGLGLSKLILNKAIEIVKKRKYKKIILNVDIDNIIAINLYQNYGFVFSSNVPKNNSMLEMVKNLGEL